VLRPPEPTIYDGNSIPFSKANLHPQLPTILGIKYLDIKARKWQENTA